MNSTWNKLVRNLRMHGAPRRLTAMLSILTAFTLLFSFAASAQPVLAVDELPPTTAPTRPTVNGLFYGDRDEEVYKYLAGGVFSDSVLYWYVDPLDYDPLLDPTNEYRRMFVAFVVDGNLNDNAFDTDKAYTDYMKSAGWQKYRTAKSLMDSEFATFSVEICDQNEATWVQGYARQFDGDVELGLPNGSDFIQGGWWSNETIENGSGTDTAPEGYESSSSMVWNLNHYAEAIPKTFDMGVNCADPDFVFTGTPTVPCAIGDWKSPFNLDLPLAGDTVTTTGGFPEVISRTATPATPLTHSFELDWEWPMVYEWSVLVGNCPKSNIFVTSGTTHHSPSKTGISNDPTPVTLTALAASTSAALLPIAGLVVGVSGIIVAPRRRRRRDRD